MMDGSEEEEEASGWDPSRSGSRSRTSTSRGVDTSTVAATAAAVATATACAASSSSLLVSCARGEGFGDEEEEDEQLLLLSGFRRSRGGFRAPVESTGDVSLREWLDRPQRTIDLLECLHVFSQIVDAVSSAHAQGVVVGNVRPSCFVMSPMNRVSFIESASCSASGGSSDSSEEAEAEGGPDRQRVPPCSVRGTAGASENTTERASDMPSCLEEAEENLPDGRGFEAATEEKKVFPLKQILLMESNWYTSPEEAGGSSNTFASDIYRLGVLLFELFYIFETMEEKLMTMSNLRLRVLPPQLLLKWPKEASFCLWLLHPQPDTRPKMSEILLSEFLNRPKNSLEEREAAIILREEIEDQELLLEFLLHLQQKKQDIADRFHDTICFISSDIEEILRRKSALKHRSYLEMDKDELSINGGMDCPLPCLATEDDSFSSGSRKRCRPELLSPTKEEQKVVLSEGPMSGTEQQDQENILSKSSRLMKNFKKLEAAYFSMRYRLMKQTDKEVNKLNQNPGTGRGSVSRTEGSSVVDFVYKDGNCAGRDKGWIDPFLEGLCKYLAFSKLKVRADLKQGDLLNSLNLVCSMGFDRDKEFFATAGVNKKIKVFECDAILNEDRDIHYPVVEMANKSKISCICWNSYIKSQIASSDFDGVVQVWDVTRSQVISKMREHEKRVWSVDFSLADPTKLASGSDDGALKLWNINQAGSIGTIKTKANVCSVHFQPDSAHTLVIGSADHKIYCYDLRNMRVPSTTLVGHMKTVSYVKYLDTSNIISASTDNSLKLWDVSTCTSRVPDNAIQTFTGHTNIKNFVGLSVTDGYIATGSETNEVVVYHKAFSMPALSYKFTTTDPITGKEFEDTSQFVSCVCWRGKSSTLLAASSSGNIKLLEMV